MSRPRFRSRSHLNTIQLGTGLVPAAVVMTVLALIFEGTYIFAAVVPPASLIGWLCMSLTILGLIAWLRHTGYVLGTGAFILVLAGMSVAVLADYWGVDQGVALYPTVAVAASAVLTAISTLRRTGEVLVAWIILSGSFMLVLASEAVSGGANFASGVLLLAIAVVPLAIAIYMVASYRSMVVQALDRVLLQSAVDAPALDISAEVRTELVALDREIEEFFDRVARGTIALPLDPAHARRAGELATSLRGFLIAESLDTWLVHAIHETRLLAQRTRIEDPDRLAGTLDRDQRDGLLSALWLLCTTQLHETPHVVIRFSVGKTPTAIRITLDMDAMSRLDIEPATWPALDRVGRYGIASTPTGVRIVLHSPTRQ